MTVSYTLESGLPAAIRDINRLIGEYKSPRSRRCLTLRITEKLSDGVNAEAARVLGRSARKSLKTENIGTSGRIRIDTSHRQGQVLRMMLVGGAVTIPSRRMRSMIILYSRYSHDAVREIIQHVRTSGSSFTSRAGNAVTIGARRGANTFVLIDSPRGLTVMIRQTGERIAFLPRSATYQRRFLIEPIVQRVIDTDLADAVAACRLSPDRFLKRLYR